MQKIIQKNIRVLFREELAYIGLLTLPSGVSGISWQEFATTVSAIPQAQPSHLDAIQQEL